MKTSSLIGYGIAFGAGLGLGYMMFQPQQSSIAVPPVVARGNTTRWTSGYHGPANGNWPGAMVAEELFPYSEMHKVSQLAPFATTMNVPSSTSTNGGLVMID